jgi:hypothetical protein
MNGTREPSAYRFCVSPLFLDGVEIGGISGKIFKGMTSV